MADAFLTTDPDLLPVLHDLERQEPIFHRPEFAATCADFDQLMAPDYWEIGASGRRYSRSFVLQTLAKQAPLDAGAANWQTTDFACRQLGPDTYLVTYTLDQASRLTRRSTIWRRNGSNWQILFHQGTMIESPASATSEAVRRP